MPTKVKKIAVVTSGGDCQSMNPAIRAIVIAAARRKMEVVGIRNAYYGMTLHYPEDYVTLSPESVENIISRGGTILNSSRFKDFVKPEMVRKAGENLKKAQVDVLIVIGGDGSMRGGVDVSKYVGIPCIGIPATIDNDIVSTEYTLGLDSAVRNIVFDLDALRDTCNSHKRCNVVEVMGRKAGQIALHAGIAAAATAVCIPENPELFDEDEIIDRMIKARLRGKRSFIVIFAEGAEDPEMSPEKSKKELDAAVKEYSEGKIGEKELSELVWYDYGSKYGEHFVRKLEAKSREAFKKYYEETGNIDYKNEYIETKFTRIRHATRGGSPTTYDRTVAAHMGEEAVRLLCIGRTNRMVCVHGGRITSMDMSEAFVVDSFYRRFRDTGSYDESEYEALTQEQKKLFRFRVSFSKHLMLTAMNLSETI